MDCIRRSKLNAVTVCSLTAGLLLSGRGPTEAGVLLQGFYWNVPSPAAGTSSAPWWWDHLAAQANTLRKAGFTAVWIPPVLKAASGGYSVGYDPFDDYDIGSKKQKSTLPTRYGTREQLERCVAMLRANGLDVYVDLVENHRSGDDGSYHFRYVDSEGNPGAGRFQKGPNDFHPNVPQDPDVPLDGNENFSQYGRDLAPINGGAHYIFNGLMDAGDWLTKALDAQGYRLDDVKGISTDFLLPFLNHGAMGGKFAIGEYYDSALSAVSNWVHNGMQNRCSAFDFPLRLLLEPMCNQAGFFNMAQLDHAGLVGNDPFRTVTFVENHDTDQSNPIIQNKAQAYAYILTAEGYPSVFYRDYSTDPGCYGLKSVINPLIWIHEKLAEGSTQQRWKDHDVFAFERLGGHHLLVGLNNNGIAAHTITVATGFGAHQNLHDYTHHAGDVHTDASGNATITIPKDANGQGYVCYSIPGISGSFAVTPQSVTQEYAGAQDLDIEPAESATPVSVCRVWVAAGKPIVGALYDDTTAWTASTRIHLELDAPSGTPLTAQDYTTTTPQGTSVNASAPKKGWYTFKIQSFGTPAANPKPAYWLKVTYTAPPT